MKNYLIKKDDRKFKIACPVCNSINNKHLLAEYDYNQASTHFCPEVRNINRNRRLAETIKKLWKQDTGYFLRCKDCGFGFGYPYVGGNEEYYKILHEQSGYPLNRWEYDITIEDFFNNNKPKKILEIGAGAGFFLSKLDYVDKFAMEGSPTTRILLRKKGIKVYTDENKLIEEHSESFNYIVLFQVLEHIAEFDKIFYTSNRLLSMNSTLIISVPDCDAMILQEKLTGFPDMFPNHISKWTLNSLNIAIEKFGFRIEKCIYEPPSLTKFLDSVYLKILNESTINGSLASSIYKIKNKNIRILFLAFYTLFVIPSLLPYYKRLDRRGSFLVKALKIQNI